MADYLSMYMYLFAVQCHEAIEAVLRNHLNKTTGRIVVSIIMKLQYQNFVCFKVYTCVCAGYHCNFGLGLCERFW